jgi:hypothetical protein
MPRKNLSPVLRSALDAVTHGPLIGQQPLSLSDCVLTG